ncbi:hypothetical protein [Gemmata sp. SH-PL17]|uniref:hypothetical protein n=1 Tax=Gemmata sp. SH-PL17 TaxID=1630693 RepID=UPI0009EE596C|nr:hypothetical protein [Gemmata sp. SH-PL17]
MDADVIRTAPHLFAVAHGREAIGAERCCYCGAPASDPHEIPDSFTAIDQLAAPGSGHRCSGCALAMTATAGQSPDGKPWMWSWVITRANADRRALCVMLGGDRVAAGRNALRAACLAPPEPPYVILLCEAGRTHTMFRAPVNRGGALASLTHDGRTLHYRPDELRARIRLCEMVSRTYGSKTARDRLPISPGRWDVDRIELLEEWHAVRDELLTVAAACLFEAPPKEEPCPNN